jgi:hypothetical protein
MSVLLATCFVLNSCLAYSSKLKIRGDIFCRNVGLVPERNTILEFITLCLRHFFFTPFAMKERIFTKQITSFSSALLTLTNQKYWNYNSFGSLIELIRSKVVPPHVCTYTGQCIHRNAILWLEFDSTYRLFEKSKTDGVLDAVATVNEF